MNALEIAPSELFNFQKLQAVEDIEDKRLMVEIHKHMLMERAIDEVKYVVGSAKDFLDAMDAKDSGKKP